MGKNSECYATLKKLLDHVQKTNKHFKNMLIDDSFNVGMQEIINFEDYLDGLEKKILELDDSSLKNLETSIDILLNTELSVDSLERYLNRFYILLRNFSYNYERINKK